MTDIALTLPDGSKKEVESGSTVLDAIKAIGPGLARAAVAARVDGQWEPFDEPIDHDATLEVVTRDSDEGLFVLRHSTAHLMAYAVQELFPDARFGFGPPVDNGFYYDIKVDRPFTEEDLERIETRMKELAKEKHPIVREKLEPTEATGRFGDQPFKVEQIDLLKENNELFAYHMGDFTDLCEGPHVPNTGELKAFKLLSVAGAYWRGDENREQLQRIYGTSWFSKKDLDEYLHQLEEAKKRDHRKLGGELDLYGVQDEAGGGPGLLLPEGQRAAEHARRLLEARAPEGGLPVRRHAAHLQERPVAHLGPHAVLQGEHVHLRHRGSGVRGQAHELPGPHPDLQAQAVELPRAPGALRRARNGVSLRTQWHAARHAARPWFHAGRRPHLLHARPARGRDRRRARLMQRILTACGFEKYEVELSVRDSQDTSKYAGTDEEWEAAERSLVHAIEKMGFPYKRMEGEAVFYGPKIDVKLVDAIGRRWQCSTTQFDFNLPRRFGVEYVDADGERKNCFMVHRAIYGSLERFIGMLTEHYAGAFPLWLAPVQATVLPVSEHQAEYAKAVGSQLRQAGLRTEVDARDEKIGRKIREAELAKVPVMLVVGGREAESGTVTVRRHGGEDQGTMEVDEVVRRLLDENEPLD